MDVAEGDGARRDVGDLLAEAAWMRALARKLVRDGDSADDLVQETWLAALKLPPIGRERLKPWLAHVLSNFARTKQRNDAHRAQRERRSAKKEALPSTAESAERIEAQRALVEALASLDEPYRTTVILRYFDGLSSAEIARRLEVPAGTVRWRLKQAVDELRAKLDRRYGGDRSAWSIALFPLVQRTPPVADAQRWIPNLGDALSSATQGVLIMHAMVRVGIVAAAALLIATGVWVARERVAPVQLARSASPPPSAPLQSDLESSSDHVLAVAADGSPASRTPLAEAKPAAPTIVSDSRVWRLDARFVDAAHHPLPGVELSFLSNIEAVVSVAGPSQVDGRIAVEIQSTETSWPTHYKASCTGRASRFGHIKWEKHRAAHLGDLVLESGGAVGGIVLQPDGSPAADAEVLVTSSDLEHDMDVMRRRGPQTYPGVPSARTGSDGTFRVDGVPAEVVRVWAHAVDMRYSLTQPIEVHAGELRGDILLELEALAPDDRISGVVRDPEGTPVPGAEIEYWFEGPRMTGGMTITARSDGRFDLDLEQKVTYDLHVRDPKDRWPEIHAPSVEPGTRDVELRFSQPRFMPLTVRAAGGDPIRRFTVQLKRPDEHRRYQDVVYEQPLGRAFEGESTDGRALIRLPTQPFLIEVAAPGFALGRMGPFTPEEVHVPLACTLTPVPGVGGHVTRAGRPIGGARVELVEMCERGERLEIEGFVRRLKGILETTTTDAQGGFQFTARVGGRRAILCDADGFATAELSPLDIDPITGAQDLEIALSPGGVIEGRVLVPEGVDPTGTLIELSRADSRRHEARVGSDGSFRFERLTPGNWQVRHTAAGVVRPAVAMSSRSEGEIRIPWNALVVEGQTTRHDIDLRGSSRCVLAARVSIDGKPALGWRIALWPDPQPTMGFAPPTASFGEGGWVRIEVPETGPHEIRLGPPEEWTAKLQFSDRIALAAGENVWQLDLRTGRLEGSVGPVNRGKHLYFRWQGTGEQKLTAEIALDARGEFELAPIPAGRGSIQAYAFDADENARWSPAVDVDVPIDGVKRVELP